MNERIDPDFDPSDREVETLRLLAHLSRRIGSVHFKDGNGNSFQKWLLAAALLLFVAGVTALATVQYTVVQRLSILETKVEILLVRTTSRP